MTGESYAMGVILWLQYIIKFVVVIVVGTKFGSSLAVTVL